MKKLAIQLLALAAVVSATVGGASAQGDAVDPALVPEAVTITSGPDGYLALSITTTAPWTDGPPALDSWWMDFYFVSPDGTMFEFGVEGEAPSHGMPLIIDTYGTTDAGESTPRRVIADTSGTIWFLTSVPIADVGAGPFSGSINFASMENLDTTPRQSNFWNFDSVVLALPLLPGDLNAGWDVLAATPIAPKVTATSVPAPPAAAEPPTTLAPTTLAPTTFAPTTLAPTTFAPTTLAVGGAGGGAGAAGGGGGGGTPLWIIIIIGIIALVLSGFMIARGKRSRLTGNTRIDLPSSHFAKELGDAYMDLPADEQRRVVEEFKKTSDKHAYVEYVQELYKFHAGLTNSPPDPPTEPTPD